MNRSLKKMVNTFVLAAFIGSLVAPIPGFAAISCRELIAESGSSPRAQLDLEHEAARIEEFIARHSFEERARAEEIANDIFNELNNQMNGEKNVQIDGQLSKRGWFKTSGKHALVAIAWAPFLLGALYYGGDGLRMIRHAGYVNFFTDHSTNFLEGMGFIGGFHHTLCAVGSACVGVADKIAPKLVPTLEKYAKTAKQALEKRNLRLNSSFPKHELLPIAVTAVLFTAYNASFELLGYSFVREHVTPMLATLPLYENIMRYGHNNIDWSDFLSGETGLIVSYLARNMVLAKLNARAAAKAEKIQAPADAEK